MAVNVAKMTTEQLEAIRKRAEAATEGTWQLEDTTDGAYITDEEHWIICGHWERKEDAVFIAHAREDVPALLAEVERLLGLIRESVDIINVYSDEEWAVYDKLKEAIAND